jgi:hypothetical protein
MEKIALKTPNRMKIAAASLALAATSVTANAQTSIEPIKVGVIDTDASDLHQPKKGIFVEAKSFLSQGLVPGSHRTGTGREHGVEVMSSFIEQSRAIDPDRPIKIHSAITFVRDGNNPIDEQKNRPMRLDYEAAKKALDWFNEQGVRVVVTAFVLPERKELNEFMDHAKNLGMVVFSATNNARSSFPPFPARHSEAISVTGNSRNLDFDTNPEMQKWVMFQSSAGIPGRSMTITPENGSSFAVGRVAAFGAHLIDRDPSLDRQAVVATLKAVSPSSPRGVPSLAGSDATKRMIELMQQMPQKQALASVPNKPTVGLIAQAATFRPMAATGGSPSQFSRGPDINPSATLRPGIER